MMKNMSLLVYILIALILCISVGITYAITRKKLAVPPPKSEVAHVEWSKNAVIYEVNIRQFTKEGTLKAFEKHLPRLQAMGVDILWLMPVNPIGIKNRKEGLGSYYSVKDYKAINPEFGTMNDFIHLTQAIHKLGMKVIIDWVPNHSAWDNELVVSHPEYYLKDSLGKFVSPFDWTDVVRFNYANRGLRNYMTETMAWWLKTTDIDGFRCDVAHMIPIDYWDELRPELEKVKPVFMLSESDIPDHHRKAYNMSYDWKFHHLMNDIAKGKKNANAIMKHFNWVDSVYPGNSYLMQFTSNHDENSWNGTEFERLGEGAKTFAVLAATMRDMLLIYNGQESAFNRRLKFFVKDSISWGTYEYADFYRTLITLKKSNQALWNGDQGGKLQRISTNRDSTVFAFYREKENDKVLVILNLSSKPVNVKLSGATLNGTYREVFTGQQRNISLPMVEKLAPWQYLVFSKNNN